MSHSHQTEAEAIQDFIKWDQTTHGQIVSNSVGMALLSLMKEYGWTNDDERAERDYQQCLTELNILSELKETPQNTRDAIKYIIAESRIKETDPEYKTQQLAQYDLVTLFVPQENKNTYIEQQYILTLRKALPLVWMALNNNPKFAHHYLASATTVKEKTLAYQKAEQDKIYRLENFVNRINSIRENKICRTGIRNELVFLLNETYENIHIIEDERSTISHFLKDRIIKQFWEKYEDKTSLSEESRQKLTKAMFVWMSEDNPGEILQLIDVATNYREEINQLFIQHGSNPNTPKIQNIIDQALQSLEFSCDPQKYPALTLTHQLLKKVVPYESKPSLINNALAKAQTWIMQQTRCDDKDYLVRVRDFYYTYEAIKDYNRYQIWLSSDYFSLNKKLEQYLEEEKELDATTYEEIVALNEAIQACKKSDMMHEVENFFAKWFIAREEKNLRELKKYYAMLLDEYFQKKVILTDDAIRKIVEKNTKQDDEKFHLELGPYEINRLFLHAILVEPEQWTKDFTDAFKETLSFIKNKFDEPNLQWQAQALKKDTYDALILQLDYLLDRRNQITLESQEAPSARPKNMILLPLQIKTLAEWQDISSLLSKEKLKPIYSIIKPLILRAHYEAILALQPPGCIPNHTVFQDFFNLLTRLPVDIEEAINDYLTFRPSYLPAINAHPELLIFFLERCDKNVLNTLDKVELSSLALTANSLGKLLSLIPKKSWEKIMSKLNLANIIRNEKDVDSIMIWNQSYILQNEMEINECFFSALRQHYPDFINWIKTDKNLLKGMIRKYIPHAQKIPFIEEEKINVSDFIHNTKDLNFLLYRIPNNERFKFLSRVLIEFNVSFIDNLKDLSFILSCLTSNECFKWITETTNIQLLRDLYNKEIPGDYRGHTRGHIHHILRILPIDKQIDFIAHAQWEDLTILLNELFDSSHIIGKNKNILLELQKHQKELGTAVAAAQYSAHRCLSKKKEEKIDDNSLHICQLTLDQLDFLAKDLAQFRKIPETGEQVSLIMQHAYKKYSDNLLLMQADSTREEVARLTQKSLNYLIKSINRLSTAIQTRYKPSGFFSSSTSPIVTQLENVMKRYSERLSTAWSTTSSKKPRK